VDAVVWAIVVSTDDHGRTLRACTGLSADGHPVIHLNIHKARCRMTRLALLAHEIEHQLRDDCRQMTGWSADAERACEEAAATAIREMAYHVRRRRPGSQLDAEQCIQCYQDMGDLHGCRQGADAQHDLAQGMPGV
jgi:hypothetical protein